MRNDEIYEPLTGNIDIDDGNDNFTCRHSSRENAGLPPIQYEYAEADVMVNKAGKNVKVQGVGNCTDFRCP